MIGAVKASTLSEMDLVDLWDLWLRKFRLNVRKDDVLAGEVGVVGSSIESAEAGRRKGEGCF